MGELVQQPTPTTATKTPSGQTTGTSGGGSSSAIKTALRGRSYDEQVQMLKPPPASGRGVVQAKKKGEGPGGETKDADTTKGDAKKPPDTIGPQSAPEEQLEEAPPTEREPGPDDIAPNQQWMKLEGEPWDTLRKLEAANAKSRVKLATPGKEQYKTPVKDREEPERYYCDAPPPKPKAAKAPAPPKIKWRQEDLRITDAHIAQERQAESKYAGPNGYPIASQENPAARDEAEKFVEAIQDEFKTWIPGLGGAAERLVKPGHRKLSDQLRIFGGRVESQGGVSARQRNSALPGFSQHHTGKAFDIFSFENGWWDARPCVKVWVIDNAKHFGFEVSYPTASAGRTEEPWHIYYTG